MEQNKRRKKERRRWRDIISKWRIWSVGGREKKKWWIYRNALLSQ
jgi:hypothetical protein